MDQPNVTPVCYPDSNRIGKFNIPYALLRDGTERPLLNALFGLCVILEMEDHESGHGKVYTAASEQLFQPLREGEEIPDYRIECAWPDTQFTNKDHEAECVRTPQGFRFKAIRQIIVRVPPARLVHAANKTVQ